MRFYEVNGGRILLDGRNTGNMSYDALRRNFGMVLQDTWLFDGTVAENIAYGKPDASREEIVAAAKAARADFFIRTLPKGYDTVLSGDAENISAGQRQLLTIARVFLCDPPILILVMQNGNIIEQGSHRELLDAGGAYADLYNSQFA